MSSADTIYALSSAPGKAGVAVMRVSGEKAGAALLKLTGWNALPAARTLQLVALKNTRAETLDKALVAYFKGPNSFTGEDVAEFYIHGGRATISALAAAFSDMGLRLAEPGEFTRRAFLNGQLDLTEAEGLADLINAETEAQRAQALRQMGGELSALYETWREKLLRILAHVEADIDFPEEDLPPDLLAARTGEIKKLVDEIDAHLNDARRGERLREGFSIAILGAPNAGKSSLINALARREAAIVSARAGTTRDVVEVHLDLSGYPVILADTAGLREAGDEIEQEGIRRALARAQDADLKLVLFDAAAAPDAQSLALVDDKAIAILSKADTTNSVIPAKAGTPFISVSAKTAAGIPELLNEITARLKGCMEKNSAPPLTRARHREALGHARQNLQKALQEAHNRKPHELVAEELRQGALALGRITGRVDVEDLLDVIFRDFCVGK